MLLPAIVVFFLGMLVALFDEVIGFFASLWDRIFS